jgi:hypothetical protein
VNGGATDLLPFDPSGGDPGDWASTVTGDSFESYTSTDVVNSISPTDVRLLDVLGYNVGAAPATGQIPGAPIGVTYGPPDNYLISDQTTGGIWQTAGTSYSGPVAGLTSDIIIATRDNINVTVETPNVFIHTGSGEDAINASNVTGNNILDGSTGSNFLLGGSGDDTFFVDDRASSADLWSTVINFHAGDAATVFGVTPADFNLAWSNNQGTAGFTGLTLHAVAAGKSEASLTLTGYTTADLTNGKLAVSFGVEPDNSGPYMLIQSLT